MISEQVATLKPSQAPTICCFATKARNAARGLLPQDATGHADNVECLIAAIEADPALRMARISDSTGLILACRAV